MQLTEPISTDTQQQNTPTETIKIPPRLIHIEKKGSGRFQFLKTQQEEKQTEIQNNMNRIKQNLKPSLNLIICKAEVPEKTQLIQEKLDELGEKLDINISEIDCIVPSSKQFLEEYEIGERLGEGCLGLVSKVIHRETQIPYAVKMVQTQDDEIIRNMIVEFKSLLKLQHDNIVKVYKMYIDFNNGFQSESKAYVLMELIEGKELFEVINELGHYGEQDAKELFRQLLSAIEYMHRHGICHRDLKPNNILCVKDKKQLKVTDFNVSKFSDSYKEFGDLKDLEKIEMWTYTGTVAFSAPEIFTGEGYNQMVDMWSAGCILYSMLSGQLPFTADYLNDLIDKIKDAQYDFPSELFEGVSQDAIELIKLLLQKEWVQRPHPDQALNHMWFTEQNIDVTRRSLKKLTLKENLNHLISSKYSNKQKQRTILLGSQSSISHDSGDLRNIDESQNMDSSIQLTNQTNTKHNTIIKSIFSVQRSTDPDLSIFKFEPSPNEIKEISPDIPTRRPQMEDLEFQFNIKKQIVEK